MPDVRADAVEVVRRRTRIVAETPALHCDDADHCAHSGEGAPTDRGWLPYAAPSLWLGLGGSDVSVSPAQLLLVLPVAATGWAATALWWQHAELTSP